MEFGNILVVFAAILVFYVLVFVFLRRFNELRSFVTLGRKVYQALPPGDMGWPIIGSSLSLYNTFKSRNDPNSFIDHLISKEGRTGMYRSHLFGKPTIIVTDPEVCRRIYLDDECFVPKYPKGAEIFTGSGSALKIADHKSVHRLMAAPISGAQALSKYVGYIEKEVVKWLEEWSSMSEPIELLNETKTLYFKLISRIFLGAEVSGPCLQQLEKLFREMALALTSIFPLDLPGFAYHRAFKAMKEVEKILNKMTEAEKRRAVEKNSEMEAMIEASDENGAKLLSSNEIIDMLLGVLHAGNHTVAHAAIWVLIHISDHPHVLQKAKEEQELILKERPPTQNGLSFGEIKRMTYLTKVINETLRRSTLTSPTFREAKANVNINGYIIPKGWNVQIWNRAVHMDPQIYINPHKFDPSRWDNYKPKAGAFIPFGMGRVYCPGSELVKLEIAILLHHFLIFSLITGWNELIQNVSSLTCHPLHLSTTVLQGLSRIHSSSIIIIIYGSRLY